MENSFRCPSVEYKMVHKVPQYAPGLVWPTLVPFADPGDPREDGLAAVDVLDGALPEEEVDVIAVRKGAHKVGRVQLPGVVLLRAQRLPEIGQQMLQTCHLI